MKSVISLCLQYFMNWDSWSDIHQGFLKRMTPEKRCSHVLSLYYCIHSLLVHRLQNVTLSYFWLFQNSTCMEMHTLQSKHFIVGFFNRKLPSSYANYWNPVDKRKCEQQGRIPWNSFVFRLSYSSSSLRVCGPLQLLVEFEQFPLFSVSCHLSFLCCFIFVTVSQPGNNVYKSIKETNSCKGILGW